MRPTEVTRSFLAQLLRGGVDAFAYVGIAIVLVAFAAQIRCILRVSSRRFPIKALLAQLQRLVAAHNVERAIKLCSAAEPAPMARLARLGLEAHLRNEDARDAMRQAFQECLKDARSGLMLSLVLGALGVVELVVFAVVGAEVNGARFALEPVIVASPLVVLVALNGSRWRASERELRTIERELGAVLLASQAYR